MSHLVYISFHTLDVVCHLRFEDVVSIKNLPGCVLLTCLHSLSKDEVSMPFDNIVDGALAALLVHVNIHESLEVRNLLLYWFLSLGKVTLHDALAYCFSLCACHPSVKINSFLLNDLCDDILRSEHTGLSLR